MAFKLTHYYNLKFLKENKPLVGKTLVNTLAATIGILISLLTINQFSTSIVGQLSLVMFYSGLIELILGLRTEVLISKLDDRLIIGYYQILVLFFLFKSILSFFVYFEPNDLIYIIVFAVDYRIHNFFLYFFNSNGNTLRYFISIIIRPLIIFLFLILNSIFIRWDLIDIYIISNGICTLYFVLSNLRLFKPSELFSLKTFFSESKFYIVNGLPGSLINYLSANILNIFLISTNSLSLLGVYSIANRLILYSQSIISTVITHDILFQVKSKIKSLNQIFYESLKKSFFFAFIYLFIYLFFYTAFVDFLPNKWTLILDFYWLFVLLGAIKCVSSSLSIFMAISKFKYELIVHILLLLLPMITMLVLEHYYSIINIYLITQTLIYLLLIKLYELNTKVS